MPLANTTDRYGGVAKTFHWLTAFLILCAFPLGFLGANTSHQFAQASGAEQAALLERAATIFSLHKTLGVLAFLTAALRLVWAVIQPHPGLLHGDRKAEALLASTAHWLLYAAMLLTPLAGWLHHSATSGFAPILWPFGQALPFVPQSESLAHLFGAAHELLQWVLLGTIVAHVAGALKHHVIDRDDTLRRMLPRRPVAAHASARQPGHTAPALAALAILVVAFGVGAANGSFAARGVPEGEVTASAPQAGTGNWQVQEGSIGLTVVQFGQSVGGTFGNFTADITFDDTVSEGESGHVRVAIPIPSLTLGSVTPQALAADYFDAEAHPEAVYEGTLFTTAEGYEARGTLTLKGIEQPVDFPFDLTVEGDQAIMAASFTLHRKDFGIGAAVPGSTVAEDVEVSLNLTATR
ncbi:cytochrome b/b6 domain-containing protein [Pseudooceanicola nanhaiensis]|uniref:cytochrome b/b6 domain-containing protein n=1 Tax=Pseudooceanicola nanhaiensis TaxID=375761 RepID=UPI001CD2437B|nr:cytochrome b/b6 domain-containing protein [Pseudooceanicola nanhaiensis]MCA0922894.1 cytochrome b/b6 domain-containing protein [Pseudooceanicola nanhaiensis]